MKRSATHSTIQWVAHRGYPKRYPENSLSGFEEALRSGAQILECDIQLSFDGVPMVFHDLELHRLTSHPKRVFDLAAVDLQALSLIWDDPVSQQTDTCFIPTLADLFQLLNKYSYTTVFIELKTDSIRQFGIDAYLDLLLPVLDGCPAKQVLISFSSSVLSAIVKRSSHTIGWIIPDWTARHKNIAQSLQPDWLFCNVKRFPSDSALIWPGPWHWCLYVINDLQSAHLLHNQGIRFLETDYIAEMLHGQD